MIMPSVFSIKDYEIIDRTTQNTALMTFFMTKKSQKLFNF